MTFTDCLEACQARCETGLARLRMLAESDAGAEPGGQIAVEVREVTNSVIAEAEAAGRAALSDARGELEVETLLWVRLARLALASGHEVVFATGAAFCPVVEAANFRAIAAGFDYAGTPLDDWFPQLRTLRGEAYRQFVARAVRIQGQAQRMVPDLLRLAN